MVDRKARDQMGFLLRRLAAGRISEIEFDDALEMLPLSGQDRVIDAIFEESFSVESASRHDVARWILFLQSEAEYLWPGMDGMINPFYIIGAVASAWICGYGFHAPIVGWALAIAEILVGVRQTDRRHKPGGDITVWPFHRQQDFEEAKQYPRLLAGKQ